MPNQIAVIYTVLVARLLAAAAWRVCTRNKNATAQKSLLPDCFSV